MPDPKALPLVTLRRDGGTQPRAALNPDTIKDYAEAMARGEQFPPVIVYHDGKDYWLADGFHRTQAAIDANLTEILVEVRQGTQRDAILCSAGANSTHGLPRSNDDKRRAVIRLLEDAEWSLWSDRKIAEACRVSHPLVGQLRASLTGNISSENRTYTTKHGTDAAMNTGGIRHANTLRGGLPPDPADRDARLADATRILLSALDDGPKTPMELRRVTVNEVPNLALHEAARQAIVDSGEVVKSGGMGTGQPVTYRLADPVIKTVTGSERPASLQVAKDEIIGWLLDQQTSQRPFFPGEIFKGAGFRENERSVFNQALDQMIERGNLSRDEQGRVHFSDFFKPRGLDGRIAHLPDMIRQHTGPGEVFTIADLTDYKTGPIQASPADVRTALLHMLGQGEVEKTGHPDYKWIRVDPAGGESSADDRPAESDSSKPTVSEILRSEAGPVADLRDIAARLAALEFRLSTLADGPLVLDSALAGDFATALADAERATKRLTAGLGRLASKAQKQRLNAAVVDDMQHAAQETRQALAPSVDALQEAAHG